jgi:membrane protein implicated in regulation of membrane protease activity
MVWPWLLIYGLLAIGAGVGLFSLSSQQSFLFALICGALSLLFCISVFRWGMMAGLSALVLFLLPKWEKRLEPPPDEGKRTAEDERED